MVDFHSHILHGVDDGSASLEESIALVKKLFTEGATHVFATPHFYADRDDPKSFFERREAAYKELCEALGDEAGKISLGAELAYFPGFSRMSALDGMQLGSTHLLLIEMPMDKWSDYAVGELVDLASSGKATPIIAHVERYMDFQSTGVWQRLLSSGVLIQSNASFFIGKTRRKALKLFKQGFIHILGSDCHNLEHRPPRLAEAMSIIEAKLGGEATRAINRLSAKLIS